MKKLALVLFPALLCLNLTAQYSSYNGNDWLKLMGNTYNTFEDAKAELGSTVFSPGNGGYNISGRWDPLIGVHKFINANGTNEKWRITNLFFMSDAAISSMGGTGKVQPYKGIVPFGFKLGMTPEEVNEIFKITLDTDFSKNSIKLEYVPGFRDLKMSLEFRDRKLAIVHFEWFNRDYRMWDAQCYYPINLDNYNLKEEVKDWYYAHKVIDEDKLEVLFTQLFAHESNLKSVKVDIGDKAEYKAEENKLVITWCANFVKRPWTFYHRFVTTIKNLNGSWKPKQFENYEHQTQEFIEDGLDNMESGTVFFHEDDLNDVRVIRYYSIPERSSHKHLIFHCYRKPLTNEVVLEVMAPTESSNKDRFNKRYQNACEPLDKNLKLGMEGYAKKMGYDLSDNLNPKFATVEGSEFLSALGKPAESLFIAQILNSLDSYEYLSGGDMTSVRGAIDISHPADERFPELRIVDSIYVVLTNPYKWTGPPLPFGLDKKTSIKSAKKQLPQVELREERECDVYDPESCWDVITFDYQGLHFKLIFTGKLAEMAVWL